MKKMVTFRMDDNIKKFFEDYATKERRSLTNFVINAVLEYIKETYRKELPPLKDKE